MLWTIFFDKREHIVVAATLETGQNVGGKPPSHTPAGKFAPGNQASRGVNKKPPPPYLPLPEDGAPGELQDMRHVWTNHKVYDETESQRNARKILNKDRKGFKVILVKMEEDFRRSKAPGEAQAAADTYNKRDDAGSKKCVSLCEDMIAEILEKQ